MSVVPTSEAGPAATGSRRWRRGAIIAAGIVVFLFGALNIAVHFLVDANLFAPSRYEGPPLVDGVRVHRYETPTGAHTGYYLVPRNGIADRLIIVFAGNGGQGRDFFSLMKECPEPSTGLLLLDYPGYGTNPGTPRRGNLSEHSLAGVTAFLRQPEAATFKKIQVLGFSLGCTQAIAVAEQTEIPIDKVFLLAPFSNLYDAAVARSAFARPAIFAPCFWDDAMDNVSALRRLQQKREALEVRVLCGTADTITLPMAKKLAQSSTAAHLDEIPGAGHRGHELLKWDLLQ